MGNSANAATGSFSVSSPGNHAPDTPKENIMYKFTTLATLAALTLGAVTMQSTLASAGNRTSVGKILRLPSGAAMGQDSVSNMNPSHFPQGPTPLPIPGQGGGAGGGMGGGSGSGGGHNHHPDFNFSFDTYTNFDPAHFCRLEMHKHRLIRVCYVSQANYAPAVSFGFGW
jgi:hypothetical protein